MNVLQSTPNLQRGIALPLFVIGMVVFIGMAGLALDMGHAYLNKTRLQNALDAAALSGAKVLNDTHSVAQATKAAQDTFAKFDIAGAGLVPTVEVFNNLSASGPTCTDPCYLRASVNTFSMPVWLAHVLPGVGDTLSIGGSAVAGPVPIGPKKCDIAPLIFCGDPGDTDCSNGDCFGHSLGAEEELILKTHSPDKEELGSGDFHLLDLDCDDGGGADCVRSALSGEYSGCIEGSSVPTEPGNNVGPVAQGLNTRFGDYGKGNGGISEDEAPPDVVTDENIWYDDYLADLRLQDGPPYPNGGVPGRRILAVPIGKCPLSKGGKAEAEILGYGCFFLTQKASHSGSDQTVYGQFIERCEADGSVAQSPPAAGSNFNLYKIVLYKDPTSSDS